jgi:hypothetical protein
MMKLRTISQRGFTVVELCLGLLVTTLVMGALAAFSLAMATAWNHAENTQAVTALGNQAMLRLQSHVRNAKRIGIYRAGTSNGSGAGAAVMLWVQDTNGDSKIQGSEVAMIEHDTAAHELVIYPASQPDGLTAWPAATFDSDPAVFDNFKIGRTKQPIARGVWGAVFQTGDTSDLAQQNPSLRFALKLESGNTTGPGHAVGDASRLFVQYGTATLRTPLTKPLEPGA